MAQRTWAVLMVLAVGLFVAAIPARFDELGALHAQALAQGLDIPVWGSQGLYALAVVALEVCFVVSFMVTSAAIVWGKPDWQGYLFSAVFVAYATWVTPTMDALSFGGVAGRVVTLTQAAGLLLAINFFLLFPDGRYVPRWTRWSAAVWAVYCMTWGLFPDAWFSLVKPFTASFGAFVALMIGWCTGLYAQTVRYRRDADNQQRRQTKWVLMTVAAAVIGYGTIYSIQMTLSSTGDARTVYDLFAIPVFWVVAMPIPVALAGAMLRYSLFDFPAVVRKTMLYGSLTAVLAGAYFSLILLIQAVTPVASNTPVVVAGSTLLVVSLFRPLRERLQESIDRRFYRAKYDATLVIDSFGERLRHEVDLDTLSQELVDVVRETMKPLSTSVWLRPPTGGPDTARSLSAGRPSHSGRTHQGSLPRDHRNPIR
ncbi:MAG: hypothetical protein ACRDKZ_04215 [Actinomycetota bacterium]